MNYFSSLCIANLGVDPWLLLAFFLFLPMFFFLKFLLHLVCIVFEAIICSFLKIIKYKFQKEFVSISAVNVKVFFIISVLYTSSSYASTLNLKELYLARGEQIEVTQPNIRSFSIGNKEVVNSKYNAAKNQILFKGKSIGFSDVVIWLKNGDKQSYHIYVVSKKEQLKYSQIASDFKAIDIKTKITNDKIILTGELISNKELKLFHEFKKSYKESIVSFVTLSSTLAATQISKAYSLLGPFVESIECEKSKDNVVCYISPYIPKNNKIKSLINEYTIDFQSIDKSYETKNFDVQVKIYKVSFRKGSDNSFGGYGASSELGSVIQNSENLVNSNVIKFGNKQAKAQTFASPRFTTTIGEKQLIQLGSEIAFNTNGRDNQTTTSWKFSGLKIETNLTLINGFIKLSQKTQITNPQDSSIQGGKSSSNLFVKPGQEYLLFNIDYSTLSNDQSSFPILGRIPILKKLFQRNEDFESESKLIAYITIKEQ